MGSVNRQEKSRAEILRRSRWSHEEKENYKKSRSIYMREWRKNNLLRARNIEAKSKAKNRTKILDLKRSYRQRNAEKIRAYNKWYEKQHPYLTAMIAARKHAKRHKRIPPFSDPKKIEEIYMESQRITMKSGIKHHVDHIVPLCGKNVSGLHVSWNLQVIPAKENLKKGNKFEGALIG